MQCCQGSIAILQVLQRRALVHLRRHFRCVAGDEQIKPLLENELLLQAVPQKSRCRPSGHEGQRSAASVVCTNTPSPYGVGCR